MPLVIGSSLGAYQIVAPLGSGGMGEVYRARDTKLNRDVAIKVLPESVALNPDHLARFKREAQVLAALNHPHIAQIYGLEEADRTCALVMEFVDGPTLAELIAQQGATESGQSFRTNAASHGRAATERGGGAPRRLKIDDALPIARQIADALEAAHESGIVHRDLKPANVKVRPDGTVKVLDFGLAKAFDTAPSSNLGLTNSPTLSLQATYVGLILGTAVYMSPEQAAAKPVDKRADIWSFGVVLWEMLTGKRLFDGETISHTLADVLRADIDFSQLPRDTPAPICELLRRCLDRDVKRRLRDIGEARIIIERAITETDGVANAGPAPISRMRARWRALPWVVAGVVLAVAAAGVSLFRLAPWRTVPLADQVKISAELGVDAALVVNSGAAAILSPDGHTLVFLGQKGSARPQLYTRRLDQLKAVPLPGTEGASSPFFSPDGRWVAFFADGRLKKVSVAGGGAVTLCDVNLGRGGSWDDSDQITFSPQNFTSLVRVPAAGGTPAKVTTLGENEATHRWPQVLPGGRAVLYTAQSSGVGYGEANLIVQPLPAGAPKLVQRGAYYGRYLSSGHLVFVRDGTLFAARFDLDRLEVTGQAVPVLEGVATNRFGGAQFDASSKGTLVYLQGQGSNRDDVPTYWMHRDGKTTPLRTAPADWSNILFAPDGRRLAVDISDGKQTDVWVYEWARDTLSRITFLGDAQKPVWTPDGRRIAFVSTQGAKGALNLFWQRADGTGQIQRLTESPFSQGVSSFHPSGKFLAYYENNSETRDDILILPIEGDEASGWKAGKPAIFLRTPFAERAPMFSPDGRWLAYQSTETGRDEVYVRPFPAGGGKWQISTDGGILPTWSRTRHELFYATPDQRIRVVPYAVEGDSFRAEKPQLWADGRFSPRARTGPNRSFDLHPDGDRFALAPVTDTLTTVKQDKVVFVFNFFDELRRVAPASR